MCFFKIFLVLYTTHIQNPWRMHIFSENYLIFYFKDIIGNIKYC